MIITLINNTDYKKGITFTDLDTLRGFVTQYYRGKEGNAYSERWTVEGDYPDTLFDILTPGDEEGWYLVQENKK